MTTKNQALKTLLLAGLAIAAFAGNSVLTRAALVQSSIGVVDFAGLRLVSGAAMLALLAWRNPRAIIPTPRDVTGIAALFTYAVAFTFAYVRLGASTGALILFATVQLSLIAASTLQGSRPRQIDLIGNGIAFAGLVWLLAPSAASPPLWDALLMVVAGIAWGIYTLTGRKADVPFTQTARNFCGAAPLAILLLLGFSEMSWSVYGVSLALASGAITSALGYVVWYAVLPHLSVATAGTAQLLVPIVAALGGTLWIGESLSLQFLVSCSLVIGGLALTVTAKRSK